MSCSVCIYGAGAVGQYVAARLAEHSSRSKLVTNIVARGQTYERLKRAGSITINDHTSGSVTRCTGFQVHHNDEAASLEPQDIVISCVKGHQLPESIDNLKQLLGPTTLLVILQNGLPFYHNTLATSDRLRGAPLYCVDPKAELSSTLSATHLAGCVARIAVARNFTSGELDLTSKPSIVTFRLGAASRDADEGLRDRLTELSELLKDVGINSFVEGDFLTTIWRKVLISASINPTNLLTRGYSIDLINDDAMAALLEDIMNEVVAVGSAAGAHLAPDEASKTIAEAKGRFGRSKFSMLQDAEAGVPLEMDPYITAVLEVAEKVQVPVPKLGVIAALVGHFKANLERQIAQKQVV